MSVYNMTLSTTEPTNNVGVINVRQGDKESQTFVAEIIENNISKDDINGYSVFLNAMFEGNIIARDLAAFDYGTGVATYTLNASFYQRIGKVSAYFSFEKDGVSDSTANFEYTVIPGACQNIRQGNYIYELEELFKISEDIIKNKDFTVLINMIKDVDRKVAEVESEFANMLSNLGKELSAHTKNKSNPHGVTAAQINTLTVEEIKKLLIGSLVYDGGTSAGIYLDDKQSYPYNYKDMIQGVYILWSSYTIGEGVNNSHFITQFIPKYQVDTVPGVSNVFILGDIPTRLVRKMVYVNRLTITGNAGNSDGDNRSFVARKIWVV